MRSRFALTSKTLAAFVALQGFDVATTLAGFAIGGCYEGNPVIRHFLPMLGPMAGLVVGKLLTVAMIFGFMTIKPGANTIKGWVAVNAGFSLVILWNASVLIRLAV